MTIELQEKALALVAQYAREKNPESTIHIYDYVVTDFSSNRRDWHATVEKKLFDGMLYVVSYDSYVAELTLKVYIHFEVRTIPDERETPG
jgi:hypothetical protein